jgi:DNA-directed RNA polymerase sigma subunit (sigma70/sigma32)
MGPSALDTLKPPGPDVVQRFYGLSDGTPWTQAAIADHLGLTKARVRNILCGAAASRLLGEPWASEGSATKIVACAVCGAQVKRTPRELRDRRQTACSPDCRRELRRQHASHLTGDAATRAKRLEHLRQKTSSVEFAEKVRQRALGRARPHAETLRAIPRAAFSVLPTQKRDLVRRYYGLDSDRPQTLAELSRHARVGEPRVRQLVKDGVARILHHVGHPAAARLQLPEERPIACTDHACDNCGICRRGLCCRGDNPSHLVKLGDWDGLIYGELGVLEGDGDRVCCHACGGWYVQLGSHAVRAHGLTAQIYKIIFGLNVTTGLAGRYRERMRPHAQRVLAPYWPRAAQTLAAMTPEQRQALDRTKRLEARRNPLNRAAWSVGAHRGGQKVHELHLAGQYQSPMLRDPALRERLRQRMRQAVADPAYRAALVRRLSKGVREKSEMVERRCVVCGLPFQTRAALVRAGQGKTCGPVCSRARRAQVLQEHRPARTAPEAWQEWSRLSARAQWRRSPRHVRITAALRALEPTVLADLGERERQLLGWYYGPDGHEALDQQQIAARLGLTRHQVADRLHGVLAQVLSSEVIHGAGDRGGTTNVRCGLCRRLPQAHAFP